MACACRFFCCIAAEQPADARACAVGAVIVLPRMSRLMCIYYADGAVLISYLDPWNDEIFRQRAAHLEG